MIKNHNPCNQHIILTNIKPFIIAPPFGNYLSYKLATNTYGTYTLKVRHGAFMKFIKTVRYLPKHKSWINQIGLKNSGIKQARGYNIGLISENKLDMRNITNTNLQKNNIISIHGFNENEWELLLQELLIFKANNINWSAVELNLSCPNVGKSSINMTTIQKFLQHFPIIVKISPKISARVQILNLYDAGVHCFHLCNTLKTTRGGVSGSSLMPYSLKQIRWLLREISDPALIIIGGGGINSVESAKKYLDLGVQKLSLATVNFNPLGTRRLLRQLGELDIKD